MQKEPHSYLEVFTGTAGLILHVCMDTDVDSAPGKLRVHMKHNGQAGCRGFPGVWSSVRGGSAR